MDSLQVVAVVGASVGCAHDFVLRAELDASGALVVVMRCCGCDADALDTSTIHVVDVSSLMGDLEAA